MSCPGCSCSICIGENEDAERTPTESDPRRPQRFGRDWTLHDAITFAIRDNFSPRLWADADDIAVVVIGAVANYRWQFGEDVFLDGLLAWDDNCLGD